jgi:ParB/RepB/Spo0J family partition protein
VNIRDIPREYREIPVGLIDDPQFPARGSMDEEKLEQLTADVRAKGVLVPINVARNGERYEVIAGHRRRIAAARAGLVVIPCVVYPSRDQALEAVKYSENRHREDLNAAEEAIWFAELLERDCHGDVDELCELLGEKRTYVESRLLLFQGDEQVFAMLQRGEIRIGIAQQLNRCGDQQYRRYLLRQAIAGGATVTVVASWIADWQRDQQSRAGVDQAPAPTPSPAPIPETNFFRCYVCQGTDNVHLMRPLNIHDYCRLAILDKLVAAYRGETGASDRDG